MEKSYPIVILKIRLALFVLKIKCLMISFHCSSNSYHFKEHFFIVIIDIVSEYDYISI